VPFAAWANLGFAAVDPAASFEAVFAPVIESLAGAPLDRLVADPARDRAYEIDAHWALYVENYLEGFHIPFVHTGLASTVTLDDYRVDLFDHAVLQTAYAKPGEAGFVAEADGRRVAARYWWVFPNLMLNDYPWGISLNHVQPLGPGRTRVVYRGYVRDAAMSGQGAGGALDRVEAEDQAIVTAVQRGVSSRFYRGGRYSPEHERGVRRFHRLLAAAMAT
jgi:choline monooxygenase